MPEPNSIISLGELSKPATTLIEKISDAVGGIFRPYQTRRVAEAEADAAVTKAQTEIQITDLQQRAMRRFVTEEGQKQQNIENIARKALPHVLENAKPQDVENDWIANFFDKSRLVSDDEMQTLWSKVLAGEANSPGSYSKRTVSLLASMDKSEAELFKNFCSYVWMIGNRLTPLILNLENPIYGKAKITFESLKRLHSIGLIDFDSLAGFRMSFTSQEQSSENPIKIAIAYYGKAYIITLPPPQTHIEIGKALLTVSGIQLALIAGSKPDEDFRTFISDSWKTTYNISPI